MAVSNFPIPANAVHTSEPAGPPCMKIQEIASEYVGMVVKAMIDGGATYGADTTNRIRRFKLSYNGLSAVELKVLTDHRAEAIDMLLGFNYRYFRATESKDELLSDCHYESFVSDHTKTWSCSCEIVIVKRPA